MTQDELRKVIRGTMAERRVQQIAKVEQFVSDRHDQTKIKLPSLDLLSYRDLDWLAGAIDNC